MGSYRVNLLSSSDDFNTLPKQWQDEAWSLFDPESKKATQLRNNSLYLRFDRKRYLKTPNQLIAAERVSKGGYPAEEAGSRPFPGQFHS